jgi:carbon storage regulator
VLILTRRAGENVVVGDDIVISVIEVRGDAVRIGIQAPRSLSVHREEVWLELQKANSAAASPSDAAVGAALERLRKRSGKPEE